MGKGAILSNPVAIAKILPLRAKWYYHLYIEWWIGLPAGVRSFIPCSKWRSRSLATRDLHERNHSFYGNAELPAISPPVAIQVLYPVLRSIHVIWYDQLNGLSNRPLVARKQRSTRTRQIQCEGSRTIPTAAIYFAIECTFATTDLAP